MQYKTEKTTLNFIKKESTNTPVINYSGFNELQEYSDDYGLEDADIIDARSLPDVSFSVDKQGFELVSFTPRKVDYLDSAAVKASYYAEVEALVKKQLGASHVVAFDHTVRRGIEGSNRHPAYHIHNDYTYETGFIRAESELDADIMSKYAGKRMVQINVWRSIAGVVQKDPLAFMDNKTLDEEDLVTAHIAFNDMNTGEKHRGEIFAVKQNPNQKWYFYSHMDSSEAMLIKGFDTDKSKAGFAMHTAFPLSGQDDHGTPRQSIETRTYAFFDDQ
ncbi:CmcJ/NvfI family oxidoreductase [uncultured Paraglaciecola sp.]|uniref:CmcJ/NvfI family oxidoreductase n=1 Tax=uncultured Paraglaciecola sp. TaxID=1765024 RepID=UPI0025943E83|nr:CmcJ/NvfI family oxidoreductase [uncultured Paraglaciecola sp.]